MGPALPQIPESQFRIYRSNSRFVSYHPGDGIERFAFGDHCLEWAKPLAVTFLKGADGELLGIVLGHAFVLDTGERLSSKSLAGFTGLTFGDEDFEKLYEGLFGAFIVIISIRGRFYLYPDAGATLSVVYSSELEIVGATAGALLCPEDYSRRFLKDLYERLDVKNEGWFPAGLTAHRGVARLYCSHRLDLETMTASRCWPAVAPSRSEDPVDALDRVTTVVRNSLRLVFDNFRAQLALTGGADSRTLLSLTRGIRDRVETFIVRTGSPETERDIYLGTQIAHRAAVPYRILTVVEDPDIMAQWRSRCGDAVGGANSSAHTGLHVVEDGVEAVIDGVGAETSRCLLWRDFDTADRIPTAHALTQRLGLPANATVTEAVQRWLDGLPRGDAFFVLDMAELELRFSAWAYAQSYVDPPLLHFSPFVSRRSLTPCSPCRSKRCARASARKSSGRLIPLCRIFPTTNGAIIAIGCSH
jgi:hypothetical protein